MTDFTQDLFARRRNVADGNTRVVSEGRLWYDSITNTIRVSDGHTPGGQIVTGQAGAYTLPTATSSVKGGVQLGANIVAAGASIDVLSPTRVSQLENDSNYLSGSVLATYATQTFVTTQGYITSAALATGNANVVAANSTIQSISANLGAYQSYANTSISTLTSNAGVQATAINRIDANLGTATTNISNLVTSANANTAALLLGTVRTGQLIVKLATSGTAANINVDTHTGQANWKFIGASNPIFTNPAWIEFPDSTLQYTAYPGTSTSLTDFDNSINSLNASNTSTQANLGAYQTFANSRITTLDANLGVRFTTLNTLHANVGAYETWANGRITTLDANLGTATTNISNSATNISNLVTQANANTAAYLTTYTGNVSTGNLNVGNYSNIYIATGSTTNKSALTIAGNIYGRGGVGYLDAIQLTNNYSTGTNPNKYIRVGATGTFEIINNAYTTNIFNLTDAGALSLPGPISISGKKAVNGPAFSAYAEATLQIITSGSQQKVLFQTEEFDTDGCNASSRFTPTTEGYYQLNAEVRLDGATGTGECMIILYKNGAEYKRGWNSQGTQFASNFWAMQVNSLVYANGTTDYFEIYVQQGSGSSVSVTAVNNTAITWFNGAMVRGA